MSRIVLENCSPLDCADGAPRGDVTLLEDQGAHPIMKGGAVYKDRLSS